MPSAQDVKIQCGQALKRLTIFYRITAREGHCSAHSAIFTEQSVSAEQQTLSLQQIAYAAWCMSGSVQDFDAARDRYGLVLIEQMVNRSAFQERDWYVQ